MKSTVIQNEQHQINTQTDLHQARFSSTSMDRRTNTDERSKTKNGNINTSYFADIIEETIIALHGLEPSIDDEVAAQHGAYLTHVGDQNLVGFANDDKYLNKIFIDSQVATPQSDPELFGDIVATGPAIDDGFSAEHASNYFA
ncbi:MAG: hypothetical protein KDJ52_16120 [Anaerolineae bacterium]|nr:hypothetical protein [Anaerolineae bacterium]